MSDLFKYGWKVVKSTAKKNSIHFDMAVAKNYLEIAKRLYKHLKLRKYKYNSTVLRRLLLESCRRKHLKMAQWIYHICPEGSEVVSRLFVAECRTGNLESAQMLYMICPEVKLEFAFRNACSNCNLDVAQWIHSINNAAVVSICMKSSVLRIASQRGHLEMVKWLLSITHNMEATICSNSQFQCACRYGTLEGAQVILYFAKRHGFYIDYEHALLNACERNKLTTAQWLVSIVPELTNYVISNPYISDCICASGKLDMVKWVCSINPCALSNECMLSGACNRGDLKLAEWLHLVNPAIINLFEYDDGVFLNAWNSGHLEVSKWISSLFPAKYKVFMNSEGVITYDIVPTIPIVGTHPLTCTDVCSICCENEINVMTADCNHSFCKHCMLEWWGYSKECPMCRATIKSFKSLVATNDK